MTTAPALSALQRPAPSDQASGLAGWVGTLTRPGSGLGFLAAALSVQPAVTVLALALAVLAALGAGLRA